MERIASFCVDHTKLLPGIYLSRQDGDINTYDIRLKKPNNNNYVDCAAGHTIEHLFATYARNSEVTDSIIYVGPMGCRTGFYLLTRGISHERAIKLIRDSFEFIKSFEGDVPGASEIECGNYLEIDLPTAKKEAEAFGEVIADWDSSMIEYNK